MLELLPARVSSTYPLRGERGRLTIRGTRFYQEDGTLFQWRGYSMFLLFLRYCRGEDITPDLHWLRLNGFNMPRIFGPLPWTETPDYRFENFRFDKLHAFFDQLERYGLRCNWSIGHYQHPGLLAHAQRWFDIASAHWAPVAELVNEPHVGKEKPDPLEMAEQLDRRGVLTSCGLQVGTHTSPGVYVWPSVLDFGTIHIARDSAWHRKARHAQEFQEATDVPWISDEPAKIVEPGFDYPGGKNDPLRTPAEAAWHAAVCALWTPGSTLHTEFGKWGRTAPPGTLQSIVVQTVRDQVWLKIGAEWQTGEYNRAGNGDSPVDNAYVEGKNEVWTYTSLHARDGAALSVRCGGPEPKAINGWRIVEAWGREKTILRLTR